MDILSGLEIGNRISKSKIAHKYAWAMYTKSLLEILVVKLEDVTKIDMNRITNSIAQKVESFLNNLIVE